MVRVIFLAVDVVHHLYVLGIACRSQQSLVDTDEVSSPAIKRVEEGRGRSTDPCIRRCSGFTGSGASAILVAYSAVDKPRDGRVDDDSSLVRTEEVVNNKYARL